MLRQSDVELNSAEKVPDAADTMQLKVELEAKNCQISELTGQVGNLHA